MLSDLKPLAVAGILSLVQASAILPCWAEPLQAGIEEEDFRIVPASSRSQSDAGKPGDEDKSAAGDPLRIARAREDNTSVQAPPSKPLTGGLLDTDQFAPQNFEIGADRNSREMVLAWERWHRQLTEAIYKRWRAINHLPGHALVRVTVTRDLHISVEVLKNHGSRDYAGTIIAAITSLDNNPGLTFPSKSQRQVVTFDSNLTAGHVRGGYTWDKRDFEKVREDD